MRKLMAVLACFVCGSAYAQTLTTLAYKADTPDPVGVLLSDEFRKALDSQVGVTLINSETEADISINLMTLDPVGPSGAGASLQTVYSALWTATAPGEGTIRFLLNQSLGACGRDMVSQCASRLIESTKELAGRHAKAHAAVGGKAR